MQVRRLLCSTSLQHLSLRIDAFFIPTMSLPEQQNALFITAKGARMTVGQRGVPKPGVDQVLVRNIALL